MYDSKVLAKVVFTKREFDASKTEDRELALRFLEFNSWKDITPNNVCPFICEWPHVDIPSMLKDKLITYFRENTIKKSK